jgi:hypothetical protein
VQTDTLQLAEIAQGGRSVEHRKHVKGQVDVEAFEPRLAALE